MPSLVGIKSLNRLEQVLLKKEAEMQGWDEALVTDVQGSVVEGVSSNYFVFKTIHGLHRNFAIMASTV